MKKLLPVLLILPFISLLSGCTMLLLGGAGTGGYYVGKDKRSVGTQYDDGVITSRIKSKFIADDQIKVFDINVDTYQGEVTLNGHVPSMVIENRAISIARATKGVKSVVPKLKIVPCVNAEAFAKVIYRLGKYKQSGIYYYTAKKILSFLFPEE